ncbi:hypothetical protein GCM10009730_28680 [Streptomyces albidochromogenes]|uniref:hypothetical protein n=1 Tax=Streptomyces albidochromogenes TaxID=329524 RepID=UPI00110F98C4|nr:hypothetical protein [Streptomyces albidochromogenes]
MDDVVRGRRGAPPRVPDAERAGRGREDPAFRLAHLWRTAGALEETAERPRTVPLARGVTDAQARALADAPAGRTARA